MLYRSTECKCHIVQPLPDEGFNDWRRHDMTWTQRLAGSSHAATAEPKPAKIMFYLLASPAWTCFVQENLKHLHHHDRKLMITNHLQNRLQQLMPKIYDEGFLKWGIPKTTGFKTKIVYLILDDLGYPHDLGNFPHFLPFLVPPCEKLGSRQNRCWCTSEGPANFDPCEQQAAKEQWSRNGTTSRLVGGLNPSEKY